MVGQRLLVIYVLLRGQKRIFSPVHWLTTPRGSEDLAQWTRKLREKGERVCSPMTDNRKLVHSGSTVFGNLGSFPAISAACSSGDGLRACRMRTKLKVSVRNKFPCPIEFRRKATSPPATVGQPGIESRRHAGSCRAAPRGYCPDRRTVMSRAGGSAGAGEVEDQRGSIWDRRSGIVSLEGRWD